MLQRMPGMMQVVGGNYAMRKHDRLAVCIKKYIARIDVLRAGNIEQGYFIAARHGRYRI